MKNHNFKIGDKVVTVYGETGVIVGICDCEKCKERGYYEPSWKSDEDGSIEYISIYEAECGYYDYHTIGEYRFNKLNKDWIIRHITKHEMEVQKLKNRLRVIKELEVENVNL